MSGLIIFVLLMINYQPVFSSERLAGAMGFQEQEQPERGEQRQPKGRLQGPRLRARGHRGAPRMAGAGHPRQALGLLRGGVQALSLRLDARGSHSVAGPIFDLDVAGDPCSGGRCGGREPCGVGSDERARCHVHEHDAGYGSNGGAVLNGYWRGWTDDTQAQLSSQKPRTHLMHDDTFLHLIIVSLYSVIN